MLCSLLRSQSKEAPMPAYFAFLTLLALYICVREKVCARHSHSAKECCWLSLVSLSPRKLYIVRNEHTIIRIQVDVAILEVGIGGRYDNTNIIRYTLRHSSSSHFEINLLVLSYHSGSASIT